MQWTEYYECHRHTTAEDRRTQQRRDAGGRQHRLVQKKSKQVGCRAILKASCLRSDSTKVIITYKHAHENHAPGSIDDVQYLPYSDEVRDRIREELEKGYDVRDVRTYLQREYADTNDSSHDAYITTAVVYNIFYNYRRGRCEKDRDDFISVKMWLTELTQRDYAVWTGSDVENQNAGVESVDLVANDGTFAFGFLAPWQKELLLAAPFISLDATHDVCGDYHNGVLYTMVIRHPVAARGVPVAYLFTNDQSSAPLLGWFRFLVSLGVYPQRITIDRDLAEDNAISQTWPNCTIQYCLWHVSRAWVSHVQSKITGGSVGRIPAQTRVVIRRRLFELMYEKDINVFHELLRAFVSEFQQSQKPFVDYFNKYWVNSRNGEGYDRWAACYQPEIYSNMETNNYVETWHNQLKTVYLKRKRLHRLDLMLDVLVTDVEFYIKQEVRRLIAKVGRMGKAEHTLREEEQKLDNLSSNAIALMVNADPDLPNTYKVDSFTIDGMTYDVRLTVCILEIKTYIGKTL